MVLGMPHFTSGPPAQAWVVSVSRFTLQMRVLVR